MCANKKSQLAGYIDIAKISNELDFTPQQVYSLLKIFVDNVTTSYQALLSAVDQMDDKQIQYHSHTLAGMCGSMKIDALYEIVQEIERFKELQPPHTYAMKLQQFNKIFQNVKEEIAAIC